MSSFTHLGYPGNTATPTLPQAPVTSSASPKSPPGSPCCETGRPIITDPVTGQTICSCQYGSVAASLYAGAYPRVPGLPEALYSSAAIAQGLLPHLAMPPTAAEPSIYPGLGSPYDFKGLSTAGGLYSYDPSLAAYPYAAGFLDPNARRKNATRESTQTLKAWLSEHKKNPYPTKGEKIMLAIITKMTLTQVSTWFANARRRLKKENKMTWEPRNRMDDDDDDDIRSDDEEDEGIKRDSQGDDKLEDENISVDSDDEDDASRARNFTSAALLANANSVPSSHPLMLQGKLPGNPLTSGNNTENNRLLAKDSSRSTVVDSSLVKGNTSDPIGSPKGSTTEADSPKPKIWSMAEIATSSKDSTTNNENNNNTSPATSTLSTSVHSNSTPRPSHLPSSLLASQTVHQGKIPAALGQGLHPAWRGATHPYLHPHFAQRLAAFPGVVGQTPPRHMLPAFTSLPQLRHNDGSRISAFSPPSSATSPTAQAERNV